MLLQANSSAGGRGPSRAGHPIRLLLGLSDCVQMLLAWDSFFFNGGDSTLIFAAITDPPVTCRSCTRVESDLIPIIAKSDIVFSGHVGLFPAIFGIISNAKEGNTRTD